MGRDVIARRRRGRASAVAVLGAAAVAVAVTMGAAQNPTAPAQASPAGGLHTATPIKHLVVVFQENVSFDHYFGTYPHAANTDGTPFTPKPGTPPVNGLSPDLRTHNPNSFQPNRMGPAQALTCDQDHGYTKEQQAFDGGKMDKFYQFTEKDKCTGEFNQPGLVMDYYDGNTVTGLWNYAQHFAMSDNSFGTVFGPSTPGALNLIAGQTQRAQPVTPTDHKPVADPTVVVAADKNGVGTVIGDPDPAFDDCSDNNHTAKNNLLAMSGKNIGDELNAKGVSWGWFQGGFRPTGAAGGYAVCGATHQNIGGASVVDYSPHHEPFQYYASTANEHHVAPSSPAAIGGNDAAHHQYDLTDFDTALSAGRLPAVSFLKAGSYQDGHAGYSDPIDEQHFLVSTLNRLQASPDWKSTAVVIAYDDSDGWYDHVAAPAVNGSTDAANDALDGAGVCHPAQRPAGGYLDRCGFGPRLPMLVISPYAKANYVDHQVSDQTSVLRFIEDNWRTARIGGDSYERIAAERGHSGSLDGFFDWSHPRTSTLLLDPATGQPRGH